MQLLATSLQQTLKNLATQEFIDNMLVGLNALHEHIYTDHEFELINVLDGGDTDVSLIQQTHDCIYNHLLSVCSLHRLKVNVDTGIRELAYVVRALLLMQCWEDRHAIIDICDSDASDEDRVCALIGLVGELTENQAGDVVEEIDPNFLRGLKNIYTTDAFSTEDPAAFNTPDEQLEKLRAWRTKMQAEKTLAFRMVKSGYRPGAALSEYLKRVIDGLLERDNNDIAIELVPFILMSRDGWQNPIAAWREISKTLSIELHDITQIDVAILKLLGEFDRLNTKGATQ